MTRTATTCIGCHKTPEEIEEYIQYSKGTGLTPSQFVIANEGTYNCYEKERFYCTICYVKAGMPLRPRRV
jgi:nitrate reductase cytochrome c-type subunit